MCVAGALLKEAVEDLEWSSGSQSIALCIRRSPLQITMCAQGLGELLIALPVRPPPLTDISQQFPLQPLESLTLLAPSKLSVRELKHWGLLGTFVMLLSQRCAFALQHRLHDC